MDLDPGQMLPLSAQVFHILIALADGERHGYAIMQDVLTRTSGRIKLSPGTLYGAIKRLLEDGLIEEREEQPAGAGHDERRRYYRLTIFGRRVAEAEAERMAALLRQARSSGLLPKTT